MDNNYIVARGDYFYYLEVFDIQEQRDRKLSSLFGEGNPIATKYVGGSQQRLDEKHKISNALIWKCEGSALLRIECLSRVYKDKYTFLLRVINREKFLEITKDVKDDGYHGKRNSKLREEEIGYLRKLEILENENRKKIDIGLQVI